jgi:hypothetical protein
MNTKTSLITLAVIIAVAIGLFYINKSENSTTSTSTTTTTIPTNNMKYTDEEGMLNIPEEQIIVDPIVVEETITEPLFPTTGFEPQN